MQRCMHDEVAGANWSAVPVDNRGTHTLRHMGLDEMFDWPVKRLWARQNLLCLQLPGVARSTDEKYETSNQTLILCVSRT